MPHCKNPLFQMDTTSERIQRHGKELWDRLRARGAVPKKMLNDRPLRPLCLGEVAEILGVSGSYLSQLSIDGLGPTPELGTAGRRSYTLRQINELLAYLASTRPKEALKFCPRRREGEKLQIISVAGGPSTTTTSLYLTHGLALQGFRVLAVDLDPKGSLSEVYGYFTATLPVHNESMYAAIRYDDQRVSMSDIIQKTLFDSVDFVPGSSELGEFDEESSRRYRSKWGYPDASIRMVEALKQVAEDYDVVVIHCAPECGGLLTVGAFEAATGVLVIASPQLADIAKTVMDAIREAGLKNQSLYELSARAVGRSAYEQAMETQNSTNAEVMDIISEVWGRPPMYVSQASRYTTEGKANSQSRGPSK
ncbi:AAA family ATPase [Rhizobium leguminosarum]|uniref:AAA family ATPase n=1 Tax=Rhizobium leguminosarum TaxID=384 RepID=UPI001C9122B3|nr:AAA family ATPase [Rhizobium leguminosarum]MBY2925999.1 AAA family ATPase [Rhizobium leguminosarum]MBY2937985.1 AAA family ATPase [Rhizobium leguminosarum]